MYPLTAKITQRWLRGQMNKVVDYWALRVADYLPRSVRTSAKLMELPEALLQVHFPDSHKDLRAAQQRLAFDEVFLIHGPHTLSLGISMTVLPSTVPALLSIAPFSG